MLIYGDRIGKHAKLSPSGSAVIFDSTRRKVLLTRRSDNGRWCLPGGATDPGESAAECCSREVVEETGANLEVVGAEVTSNQFTTDDLTVIIGVSGRLEGNVLSGFSEESAQSIVGVMLGEPVSTVNDELALSAIGEIGNMITGNAAARLAELGYTCNISPPVIINPAGSRFTTVVPQILVKFTSSVGGLAVRIGLTENSRPD